MIKKSAPIGLLGQKCLLLVTVLFGIVTLYGCYGDNGTDLDGDGSTVFADGSSPMGTNLDFFCNSSAELTCSLCRDCYQIEYASCFESSRENCFESSNNALENEKVLDKAAIDRCLEVGLDAFDGCEYRSVDSTEYQQSLAVCREIFRETNPVQKVAENGECDGQIAGQCENGLYCEIRNQPARCLPLRKLGSACEYGSQCSSRICRQGSCIQLPFREMCESLVSE